MKLIICASAEKRERNDESVPLLLASRAESALGIYIYLIYIMRGGGKSELQQ